MKKIHFFLFLLFCVTANFAQAQTADKVFVTVEKRPEFPGGERALIQYLAENVKYPKDARENGTEGKVFIQFVVEKDGSVGRVELLRGIGKSCDEEAVRVIKSLPNSED